MRASLILVLSVALLTLGLPARSSAQSAAERRDRARIENRLGWDQMKAESWEAAARSFQKSIDIDEEFEMPYYGLGRANMAMKKYVSAIAAYAKCRDLYEAQAGRQFSNDQDRQRSRNDRITEYDEMIRQVQAGPQTIQTQDQLRQLQEQKRQLQDAISRGNNITLDSQTVPSWVSLALGSAYFRGGRLPDAESAYKAAISADRGSGEAHNNLAVVYLETGRFAEAEASIKAAKKAGFRVHPQLEQDIKNKAKGGS